MLFSFNPQVAGRVGTTAANRQIEYMVSSRQHVNSKITNQDKIISTFIHRTFVSHRKIDIFFSLLANFLGNTIARLSFLDYFIYID